MRYEPYMQSEALDQMSLRGDLQRALREGEFRLQYQPHPPLRLKR